MDVSIIIVNYNTKQLLLNCLDTLWDKTQGLEFEVIVVDNGSIDGSEEYIYTYHPKVKWINSGENLGFGKANNLGVKHAQGKYIFFLNSDTLLINNAVHIFYEYAEKHRNEKIGVLGSWLLDKYGQPNNSYGFFPNVRNEINYLLGKYSKTLIVNTNVAKDVDYITGADLFIDRKFFEELGGFDDNIFMYYEETDLQYRIANLGLSRRIIPGPRIIHLEGGSFGNKGLSVERFIMAQTSYNYYMKKNYRGVIYFFNKLMLCVIRLSIFVTTKWTFAEKLKAYKCVLFGN